MPNAKVLETKKSIVDALSDKIQNATSAVFVDYKGITVAQDTELRNQFRAANVEYSVVKNTLTRFAANKAGYTEFDELLNGTTSMASTTEDPIAPARVICEFAKKNKNVVKIKGGMVEGKVLSVDELMSFGELPSKNALVAQVLGTFLAPISSLAVVLNQILEQKGRRSCRGCGSRSLISLSPNLNTKHLIGGNYNGIRKDYCYDRRS